MAFLEGMLTGLAMVAFVGPVFFTLLQVSLQFGFRSGFLVALGIFVSDVVCVVLCYYGASAFFTDQNNEFWIAIIGSIVLFFIGGAYLFKKGEIAEVKTSSLKSTNFIGFFTKGFLVNFVNPFVFAVWIAIVGKAQSSYATFTEVCIYLSVTLIMILLTDSLKALLAQKIKRFLKPKVLSTTYKIIGVLMLLFAIRILYYIYTK